MSRSALSGSWTTLSSESFASSSWKTKVRFSLSSTAVSHAVSSAMEITKSDRYVTFLLLRNNLWFPQNRPFETDCRIFTTLFGLILTHLFDWHSLKLFLREVDVDQTLNCNLDFITVFIITGTECCRPKRRNIYSPRSMNLKTKELKRRQPKDESEIWLTPMRYHRSDVIRMTSSSVPERIFFFRDHSIT